jgi:glycosyltransferase involved in cell wall biosynthesis
VHVLFVTPAYTPFTGGGERYAQALAQGLLARGHRVTVATSAARREQEFWQGTRSRTIIRQDVAPNLTLLRCPLAPFPGGRSALLAWRKLMVLVSFLPGDQTALLLRMARFVPPLQYLDFVLATAVEPPDLVHTFNISWEHALVAGWRYARQRCLPYIVTPFLHFGETSRARVARNSTMDHQRRILNDAAAVLTLTAVARDELATWGIHPHDVAVAGGGVDSALAAPQSALLATLDVAPPFALFVGRASFDKGAVHAVQAHARLRERGLATTLALAGDTTPDFDRFLRNLPLQQQDQVRILGRVSEAEKHALLQAATFLLLPSRVDSFGIVLLEAWAQGTPVVAAAAGGIPDVVDDGSDGLLVPFGDVGALATAMEQLFTDAALRDALGARGREKVQAHYRWEQVTERVLATYERALSRARARAATR